MNASRFDWNGQSHMFSALFHPFISISAAIRHLTAGFPLLWLLCGPQPLSAHSTERLSGDYQEKLYAAGVWISSPLCALLLCPRSPTSHHSHASLRAQRKKLWPAYCEHCMQKYNETAVTSLFSKSILELKCKS